MKRENIAVITGANRGIGLAIARGLAQLNYKTVLIGRKQDELYRVAESIKQEGNPEPSVFAFDITNSQKVKTTVKDILDKFGRIDVLVNNAGIYHGGTSDISEKKFRKMLETNLTAQFVFVSEIIPAMKKQRSGYIFNVASRAGKIGFPDSGGYSASKFGLVGLTESLYRELNPLGIRVTALCPGWVNTSMAFEAGTPLNEKQMIQPNDLFETVKWLLTLSPGACVKEIIIETPFNIS